jgi:5-keto 4-deoxyuronate isomerase
VINDYAKFSVLATCNIPAVLEYNWHIGTSQNFAVGSSTLLNSGNGDGTIMFGPVVNSNNNKFLRVSITAHTQYGTVNVLSNSAKFTVKT